MGRDLGQEFLREWVYRCFPELEIGTWPRARTDGGEIEWPETDRPAHYRLRHELYCQVFDWQRGSRGTQPSPMPLYLDSVAQLLGALGLTARELLDSLDELALVSEGCDARALRRRLATGRRLRLKLEDATRRCGGTPPQPLPQLTDAQRRGFARQRKKAATVADPATLAEAAISRLREYAIPQSVADLIRDSPTARRVIGEIAAVHLGPRPQAPNQP